MSAKPSKTEWIRNRAKELWEREGRAPDREQACWDKAVEEFEAGTAEEDRGPVKPDPKVKSDTGRVRKP